MYRYEYVGDCNANVRTESGVLIADGFSKIVHGERGAYVEFWPQQVHRDKLEVPENAKWRLTRLNEVFYTEYCVVGEPYVKVYFQLKCVDYANYKVGMWYISPAYLRNFERKEKTEVRDEF